MTNQIVEVSRHGGGARYLSVGYLPAALLQRWAAARVWAAGQAPYLASALLALDPVVVDQSAVPGKPLHDLRRLPSDQRWHVYLDPVVLASMDVPTIGFWLLHQVTHLVRDHANRYPMPKFGDRDPFTHESADSVRWNLAGDAEINDDLVAGAVALPPDAVTPTQLGLPNAWTAEQYWDALGDGDQAIRDTPLGDLGLVRDRMAAAHPNSAGRLWADGGDELAGPAGSTDPSNAFGDCGGGCDGWRRGWDCDRPGIGHLGSEIVRRQVAHHIQSTNSRGRLPAGWQRWAQDVLAPTVDWRRQLAAAVRHGIGEVSGRVDFTYRRPSRRASATPDVVLPSLRQPLPRIAIVVDTSGSMGEDRLTQALAEVNGVLRAIGLGRQNLQLICCDARAYQAQRIFNARDVRLTGGGGTNMGAGLTAAVALRPKPDMVIVLTDGHTPWPAKPPTRVIVGLIDPKGRSPHWAHTVPIGPAHSP